MWWPGTELNRRRQPFQGCALPPELPGHFRAAHLSGLRASADARAADYGRPLCAHTGRGAAKQKIPVRWDCAELSYYNKRIITT